MRAIEKTKLNGICAGTRSYCSTLASITQNNVIEGGALTGAISGFFAGDCGSQGYTYVISYGVQGASITIYKVES